MGAVLFIFMLLVWNFPEVQARPTGKENVVICDHNVCIAGKVEKDGTCICCIVCRTSFNRENGSVACPLNRHDCSDHCIDGYENKPLFNGGTLDVCKRSKATTKIPDIPSNDKLDNQVTSGTITAAIVVPLVFIVIVILAVIYKLRSKKSETSELALNDLNVGAAEYKAEEAEVDARRKQPEENMDVTTVITDSERKANVEENHLEQSSPIDVNETNPNQTFQPNVDLDDEPPHGGLEIPTAPYSSITDDTNPSLSSTYSAATAGINDGFRGVNNGLNTQEKIRLTLDLTLTPLPN